jgi:uncharacterized protein (TIGR03083 family)
MAREMKRPDFIYVADRFPALRARLLELLAGLSAEEWTRPTTSGTWRVKDIASHLLGGDLGNLSRKRDGYASSIQSIDDYRQLVQFVNGLNHDWVRASQRLSPRILCDLLAFTGPQIEAYFASLDPKAIGGPVSWAGSDPAPVWFDVAREFTERWHHQQQIRDATGRPPLYEPYFLQPVLDTFVRALPYTFHETAASEGTILKVEISGEAGGCWFLRRSRDAWDLFIQIDAQPSAEVTIPQDAAWRLFTRGIGNENARRLSTVRGDAALAAPVFETLAVLA